MFSFKWQVTDELSLLWAVADLREIFCRYDTKIGLRKPVNFSLLGYGFVPTYRKGEKGKYQLVVSEKGWKTLKQKIKMITRKTTPMTFDERIEKLNGVMRGWTEYFRMASMQEKLKDLDGWTRNRLRYCIWHH